MIKNWIKTKKLELELKRTLYTCAASLLHEKEGLMTLAANLYAAFKDVPASELKEQLISKIAELSHEQAVAERTAEESID